MAKKRRILADINKKMISKTPLVEDINLFLKPKGTEIWTCNFHNEPYERLVIYLRSDIGCEYGITTGGCTGCRHWRLGTAGQKINIENIYVKQYLDAIETTPLRPIVCIYNEGNMLNENEIPKDQLLYIVDHLSSNSVKKLVIESRNEYINDEILEELKKHAKDMVIEVGIGLESHNSIVRNEIFLKSTTLNSYKKSISMLSAHNMLSLTYVIVKPPFLNEAQGLHEALETTKYAFSVGSNAVSLEPIGVEPYTITKTMYDHGLFSPTKLWSIIDIVKKTYKLGEVRIGGPQFHPRPIYLPSNCEHCTKKTLEAIDKWNYTFDIKHLKDLECSNCLDAYKDEIETLPTTIDNKELFDDIARFVINYNKK